MAASNSASVTPARFRSSNIAATSWVETGTPYFLPKRKRCTRSVGALCAPRAREAGSFMGVGAGAGVTTKRASVSRFGWS